MGRISKPQKSGKHKKMKSIDPFYVGDRPVDRLAARFNLKPKKEEQEDYCSNLKQDDSQETEHDHGKTKKKKSRNKYKNYNDEDVLDNLCPTERGITRPAMRAPDFRRHKGESEETFLHRVDRVTHGVISRAQFEDKYKIREFEPEGLGKSKKSSVAADGEKTSVKSKMRLIEKRKKLKESKLHRRKDQTGDFKALKDEVKFGEVTQQPPTLTFRPRKAAAMDSKQQFVVGDKKLLLAGLLEPRTAEGESRPVTSRPIGQTVKRKKLSLAERDMIDRERERTIELYRQLKKSKQSPIA